jgi:hypothetical protein
MEKVLGVKTDSGIKRLLAEGKKDLENNTPRGGLSGNHVRPQSRSFRPRKAPLD